MPWFSLAQAVVISVNGGWVMGMGLDPEYRRGAMNVEASSVTTTTTRHSLHCHLSLQHLQLLARHLAMSANKPDQVSTPTDSNGPTPVSSRLDLTIVPATPPRPGVNMPSRSGTGESTRLLATKHPKYWGGDATDSEAEDTRGRGGASSRRAGGRDGEWWQPWLRGKERARRPLRCDGAGTLFTHQTTTSSHSESTASTQRLQKATRVAKTIRQRSKYYVPVRLASSLSRGKS